MKRTSLVLIFLFTLLLTASAFALTADVTVKVNGVLPNGSIQMIPGADNVLEFWITNSAKIKGMTLGFELTNSAGPFSLVKGYGNIPYEENGDGDQTYDSTLLKEHGTANSFKNSFGLGNLFLDREMAYNNIIFFGGVDMTTTNPQTKNILVHLTSTLAYSVKVRIPAGQAPGLFCVQPIFIPPAGAWIIDAGKNIDSLTHDTSGFTNPNFQGLPTGSSEEPAGMVCFGPPASGPEAICQDVTVGADGTCHANASIDHGSTGDAITLVQVPAGPYPLGNTLVSLIVTDSHGAADTCQATVHVVDVTKPTITCPANIVKGNDVGQCGAVVTFSVGATDFCTASPTIVSTPSSGTFFPIGLTAVKSIATDAAGNKDSCSFTVTVNDTQKPTVTCPANIVKVNDVGQCGAIATFVVTAADNCPGVTVVAVPASGSLFPIGITTVWSKATDAAGNKDSCSFTVTVNDTQKPTVTCPANIVKDNDAGQCGAVATFSVTAADNCPGVTVVAVPPSGSVFPIGATTVWSKATDAAGNKDSCSFTVTVNDTQKPVVACPANIVESVNPGESGKIVVFAPTVTDNCPGVTFVATPASGSLFPLGVTPVKVVATDAHGLKDSCSFTIEVKVGLVPDFAIDANPDSIVVMQGIPGSLLYDVDLTSIDLYSGSVNLSVSTLPTGVVLDFGANPVNVPNSTTLGGHTSVSTPAGVYELTITATEVPTKAGPHSTVVRLIVVPCSETPIPVVSQEVFNVQIEAGQNLPNDSLFVTNGAPCGSLFWLASSDQDWVSPDPNQGSVNAGETPGSQVFLNYTTAALAPDNYVAHVTFVSDKKKTPGAEVTINLTVTPKPLSTDSIRVAHANVYAGSTVAVPVYFNNNEWIGGMTVGLHWNSDDVTLDSVTHVGSRVEYVNFKFATINAANKTLLLGMATLPPEPFLMPGSGLWATMWFTAGPNCPVAVAIDSQYIGPGGEVVFADSLAQLIYPQFAAGSITVDCAPSFCISGTITDTNHDPILDATVELYSGYPPSGNPIATTTSGPGGSYEFCPDVKNSEFSVRAYKPGYYPDYVEAEFPATDLVLMLRPIVGTVTPTNEWVNLYCDLNALFNGTPVLPGSVVEAYDPQGVLCGQWIVSQAGTYGFMPVYRDDPYTPSVDEGCVPDDLITVKVDGFVATMANDPIYWGTNGDRYEACFDVTPVPPTHCLILKQGWNLVSWNIDTPNDSIMILAKDVMDNVDVILSFEMGAQTYDPKLPDFSTLLFADHYHGFWFRMNAEATLCVEGPMVAASTPIDLEQNWNLVSYLPTVPFTVPVALASIFDKVVVVLGYDQGALTYDPAYPQFNNLDEMERDFGYWIKTTDAATLVYPGPILAKTAPSIHKSDFTPRTSQSNTWVNLYGFDVKLNGATLPVGTVIEAYNTSGALIGESVVRSAGRFGFMPVYGAETLTGDAVGKSAGSAITLKVNGEVAEQTVTWTGNGDRIRINELTTANKNNGNLPTSFTLNQNYPNPFNPETAIDYVVGTSGHVELAIYNILGDKIKTLVSGYQVAGSYTIKWQADTDGGTSVASGVYFYKLTAGDYTDTKKMTLLK